MEISVYLQDQDHARDAPAHYATRRLMRLVLAADLAEKVGQHAIRLTTDIGWKEIKAFARQAIKRRRIEMSSHLPIRTYPSQKAFLDVAFQRAMSYPILIAKDQRSCVA